MTTTAVEPLAPPAQIPADELLVAGEWRPGAGPEITCTDPATGCTITTLRGASASDVDAAARAAHAAADAPAWRDLLPHRRARLLHRIADGIDGAAEELARLQTLDTGKTLAETRALAASAAGTYRYLAAACETADGELPTPRGEHLAMTVHEPVGVVAAITPWNSPIASDAQKIAPALAAGNAVLLKPAPWAPLVSLAAGRIVHRALLDEGLPPALVSVLPGSGAEAGEALVRHDDVGIVSFTGGTATGRRIAEIAGRRLIPVSLELGGKSPAIICPDADLDHAVAGTLYGIFSSSGQSCVAGSRIFVPRDRHDELVARLADATRRLRVGPGTDPRTQVGPLVHHDHRDRVAAMVDRAVAAGARVVTGGRIPDDPALAGGAYYLPTVLDRVEPAWEICREEVFGPVAVVLPYDDEDDLVRQADDTAYGLACGIWTADHRRAWRIARRVRAGTVWVNTHKQFSISTPFGGVKDSGLGVEKGRLGLRTYSTTKSVYWSLAEDPIPWAAPR
ncbi:aldehyde dehydrogenase family protein [Pseudonocardia sp. C8]|uniref:aldehyde dehydrogenase family protein n=1 Tax=Pseudonocardia sp. C8 TaxID=2762759 RepID=UPI00351C29D3